MALTSVMDKLYISDTDMHDDEGLAGVFTKAERKSYEDARTYKTMKNRISLDNPELAVWQSSSLVDFTLRERHNQRKNQNDA